MKNIEKNIKIINEALIIIFSNNIKIVNKVNNIMEKVIQGVQYKVASICEIIEIIEYLIINIYLKF